MEITGVTHQKSHGFTHTFPEKTVSDINPPVNGAVLRSTLLLQRRTDIFPSPLISVGSIPPAENCFTRQKRNRTSLSKIPECKAEAEA